MIKPLACALKFSALLLLAPSLAPAADLVVSQDAFLTQNVNGNLIVTGGATVTATQIQIDGNVIVNQGASLYGQGVSIGQDVTADGAGNVVLTKYSSTTSAVFGDVDIRNSSGVLRLFDAQVYGHVSYADNPAYDIVVWGCFFNGDLQLSNNTAERKIVLRDNIVLGAIQTSNNNPRPGLVITQSITLYNDLDADLTVTDGAIVISRQIQIEGNVSVDDGASFYGQGVSIGENLTAEFAQNVVLTKYGGTKPIVFGDVDIRHSLGMLRMFDAEVYGYVLYEENAAFDIVVWGCTLYGNLQIFSNTAERKMVIRDNIVLGTIQTNDNDPAPVLSGNWTGGGPHSGIVDTLNQVLADGWSFELFDDGPDIRLLTFDTGDNAAVAIRFGSAGVISDLDDARNGEDLLAPRLHSKPTDRVLQWTMWEQGRTAIYNVPSLPDYEDRYNLTQAGAYTGILQKTVNVELAQSNGQLDVWAVVDRQWKYEIAPYISGTISALTRVNALDGGALLVRRVIRVGETTRLGQSVFLDNPYYEAWSPFSDRAFNSLALSIDGQGNPTQWYADSVNIPHYPSWPVANTRGWAMAYDRFNMNSGQTMSVVYGQDPGQVYLSDGTITGPRRFVLNTMDFAGGLAILPALWPAPLPTNSIIDQSFIFVPTQGITGNTPATLDALSDRLPAPRVFHPGADLDAELAVIALRLQNLADQPYTRTDNLGTLVDP